MAITRREVLHVAKLARLELTEEEVERLTEELGAEPEEVADERELIGIELADPRFAVGERTVELTHALDDIS